jgi:hypothetical protein
VEELKMLTCADEVTRIEQASWATSFRNGVVVNGIYAKNLSTTLRGWPNDE